MREIYQDAFDKACNKLPKKIGCIAREALEEIEVIRNPTYTLPITNVRESQKIAKSLLSITLFLDYRNTGLGITTYKSLFNSVEINRDMKLLFISMDKEDVEIMFPQDEATLGV